MTHEVYILLRGSPTQLIMWHTQELSVRKASKIREADLVDQILMAPSLMLLVLLVLIETNVM